MNKACVIIGFLLSGCAAVIHPETRGTKFQRDQFAKQHECLDVCESVTGDHMSNAVSYGKYCQCQGKVWDCGSGIKCDYKTVVSQVDLCPGGLLGR